MRKGRGVACYGDDIKVMTSSNQDAGALARMLMDTGQKSMRQGVERLLPCSSIFGDPRM